MPAPRQTFRATLAFLALPFMVAAEVGSRSPLAAPPGECSVILKSGKRIDRCRVVIQESMAMVATGGSTIAIPLSNISEIVSAPPEPTSDARGESGPLAPEASPGGSRPVPSPPPAPTDMRIEVIDDQLGRPIAKAMINWGSGPANGTCLTDEKGRAAVPLPRLGGRVSYRLLVEADGYVPAGGMWICRPGGDCVPPQLLVRLQLGVELGGGIIVDREGAPIAGAVVQCLRRPNRLPEPDQGPQPDYLDAQTGPDGRWRFAGRRSKDAETQWGIMATHPGYFMIHQPIDMAKMTRGELRLVMESGVRLEGTVVDSAGKPLPDVWIRQGDQIPIDGDRARTRSDVSGHFTMPLLKRESTPITVQAQGYAPQLIMVKPERELKPLRVVMPPAATLRLRLLLPDGRPAAGVLVDPIRWKPQGFSTLFLRPELHGQSLGQADSEGRFVWDSAPPEEFEIGVHYPDFKIGGCFRVTPSAEEITITIHPPQSVPD